MRFVKRWMSIATFGMGFHILTAFVERVNRSGKGIWQACGVVWEGSKLIKTRMSKPLVPKFGLAGPTEMVYCRLLEMQQMIDSKQR